MHCRNFVFTDICRIAGQLVEDVSGQPFADYMVQHVFEPLGMHCTDYRRTKRIRDKLAIGYKVKRGRFKPVEDLEIIPAGAGTDLSVIILT